MSAECGITLNLRVLKSVQPYTVTLSECANALIVGSDSGIVFL